VVRKTLTYVCGQCRKKQSSPRRRKFCPKCAQVRNHTRQLAAARAYRANLKKQGRCLICRKPAKGKSRCKTCLRANALGTRRWYRKQKRA
jgi:hypothetical protein